MKVARAEWLRKDLPLFHSVFTKPSLEGSSCMIVTSTSAVRREAPWRIAAWAPKRYQRAPLCLKTPSRSERSLARGVATGYPHQKLFLRDMVIEIALSIEGVRPFGSDRSHVLPQRPGCPIRTGGSVPAILGSPVCAIQLPNPRPIAVCKCEFSFHSTIFHAFFHNISENRR